MKRLDSSEIVGIIGKAADAFLKSLALLAACLHHRLRWVEPCWSIWWCFIFRCASIFWIQISLPKIIFCLPNIHPPAETLGLLVDIWSVTAAGQNHHFLPLDSEADFDPCQAPFSYLTLHCIVSFSTRVAVLNGGLTKFSIWYRKLLLCSWPFCSSMVSCTKFEASSDKKLREHMF